jgi:hypothetical protein
MQTLPPKYQSRLRLQPEETSLDPLDHEEERVVPPIPFLVASYAKDCIPLENKCNVTVVTKRPPTAHYSYLSASAGKILAADHDG